MERLLISLAITIFGGGLIALVTLKYFYKKSILYTIGLYLIYFAILIAVISRIGQQFQSLLTYIFALPIALIALIVIFKLLNKRIKRPLMQIITTFSFLEIGDIESVEKLSIKTKDEFNNLGETANKLIDNMTEMSTFAKAIGEGDLDINYTPLDEKDILGNSLIKMQQSLQNAKVEDEKRKEEDAKQSWVNEGHAKFGEILRSKDNNDSQDLYFSIIKELVKYLEANQGGIYLINSNDTSDEYIELVGLYAYERRKHKSQRFEIGSSLVGQAVLEKDIIYLTDIPDGYTSITSGLGESTPANLLITPLIFNEEVVGVIEMASFKIIEKYQIEFVKKVGESIASAITSHKINTETKFLLEQSQQQTEEMKAQEEEMRQNLEEMQATQEEMSRFRADAEVVMANLDSVTNPIISIDNNFNVTYINKAGVELAGVNKESAIKMKCYDLWGNPHCHTNDCRCAMSMQNKQAETGRTQINASKKDIIYIGTPLLDSDGKVIGSIEEIIDLSLIKEHLE